MSIGDALRAEAKRRAGDEWDGKMSKVMSWLKAADYIDEAVDLEILADALREKNTTRNGHVGHEPWAEVSSNPDMSHMKDIWMRAAVVLVEEIEKAIERRQT